MADYNQQRLLSSQRYVSGVATRGPEKTPYDLHCPLLFLTSRILETEPYRTGRGRPSRGITIQ